VETNGKFQFDREQTPGFSTVLVFYTMPAAMRIVLEHVGKRFGDVAALQDLSLDIASGERSAVLGPSGSGKTTMLRLIADLERPSSGTVKLDGTANGPGSVAMVFQTLALFPHLTAGENIALGLRVQKLPAQTISARTQEVARVLSITPLLHRRPQQLSAGERQRVALGRALVKRPAVLLLDEPSANLDSHLRIQLRSELKRLHAEFGMTMICVTHDLLEALSLGQRIAVLNGGRLEQFDTPQRLLDEPASDFVKSFLALPEVPAIARQFLQLSSNVHEHVSH
jgi:multiple sugar transport system ATP-binding protein